MSLPHFTFPKITFQVKAVNFREVFKVKVSNFSSIRHVLSEDHEWLWMFWWHWRGTSFATSRVRRIIKQATFSTRRIILFLLIFGYQWSETHVKLNSGQLILTTLNNICFIYMHVIYYFFIISDTACNTANAAHASRKNISQTKCFTYFILCGQSNSFLQGKGSKDFLLSNSLCSSEKQW